jgi:hypothetical protein
MKQFLVFIVFCLSVSMLSCGSSGSSGENVGNINDKKFVFPMQEYVQCFNNESYLVRMIDKYGNEFSQMSAPITGCHNVVDYKKGELLSGEYLFTIFPDLIKSDLDNTLLFDGKPYEVYKKDGKLTFYCEMPNLQNQFKVDTLSIVNNEKNKKYIYKILKLPDFTKKQDFLEHVDSVSKTIDYIMFYQWIEPIASYNIMYVKDENLVFMHSYGSR